MKVVKVLVLVLGVLGSLTSCNIITLLSPNAELTGKTVELGGFEVKIAEAFNAIGGEAVTINAEIQVPVLGGIGVSGTYNVEDGTYWLVGKKDFDFGAVNIKDAQIGFSNEGGLMVAADIVAPLVGGANFVGTIQNDGSYEFIAGATVEIPEIGAVGGSVTYGSSGEFGFSASIQYKNFPELTIEGNLGSMVFSGTARYSWDGFDIEVVAVEPFVSLTISVDVKNESLSFVASAGVDWEVDVYVGSASGSESVSIGLENISEDGVTFSIDIPHLGTESFDLSWGDIIG